MSEHIGAVELPSPPALLLHASTLRLQRKCACGGTAAATADRCEECGKHGAASRSNAHSAAEAKPAPEPAHVPGFVVDDGTVDLKPGQMRKSEFLAEMRVEVCRTAEEALAGTGRNTAGCPYLDYWFHHYAGQAASHIEKALLRYAPAAASAASAREYIAIAAERARMAVVRWVRTGEVDAPKEAMAAQPASRIQFKAGPGGPGKVDSPAAVRQQLGGGAALPGDVRGQMESAFGHDFSRVRVHADAGADRLATGLNAHAFTIGGDVAFAAGTYRPGTPAGDALIAHELAHVVQQAGAGPESGSAQVSGAEYRSLENDADRAAVGVIASLWSGAKAVAREAMPRIRSGLSLQRCSKCDPTQEVIPTEKIKPSSIRKLDCSKISRLPNEEIVKNDPDHKECNESHCTLGLTTPHSVPPKARFEPTSNNKCTLKWDQRPDLTLTFYGATQPGKVPFGTDVPSKGVCAGKTVTKKLDITEAMSKKIKAAENEHCEDLNLAYAKTFARVEQFYDDLAVRDICPQKNCRVEFIKRFRTQTGVDFDNFDHAASCYFGATLDRDAKHRDGTAWHTVTAEKKPTYSKDCTEALYSYDLKKAYPDATENQHPYETLVKDCPDDGTRP